MDLKDMYEYQKAENLTTQFKRAIVLKDHLLIPLDPLNPPTVSLFFSDLLPT